MSLKISSENALSIERKSTCKEDKSSSSNSRDLNTIQSSILCAECGEQFMFATKLVEHGKKTQHRPFACQYKGCKKYYTKREHLTRHVETVHVYDTIQSLEQRKRFKCRLCEAQFAYNHGLTRHIKRSHWNVNLPFECFECLRGFKKKSELQAHSYVHTGVLPFECEECGERFLKRFWLTRHQRKHDANKKADAQVYVCDCGKICFDEDKLESHKQIEHSSEDRKDIVDGGGSPKEELPTSVCLVCDQTFSRKQYLRAHLRTYFESLDARKQYTCPMDGCDKAYTRSSNLMAHYNAVHDKQKSKRFACPREDCTARFGYKTVLKHHIESIHDNPKPPKRRERKSVGILERVLGVNQLGEQEPQVAIVVEKCLTEPP
ncbi:unnamed protein product [Peronospora destructor]|uniref:C2H2-type domain-containing protein n=1 Tax=Peronospora destructor TaxID=86335 RepID=A0AAV0V4J0_9STRA|nr:unnamed protein product [Peronospora destructor]